MKATLKKEGKDTLSINVLGFDTQIVSYENFFEKIIYKSNNYCYVDSVEYNNTTIAFNKIDPEYDNMYRDEYKLSLGLIEDEEFMKLLNKFLDDYKDKKDQLNTLVEKELSSEEFHWLIRTTAKDTYKEYCENGKIKSIYWDEIALRVAIMCKNNKDKVSQYSWKGTTHPVYDTKLAEKVRMISGAAVYATGAFIISTIVLSTKNLELLKENEAFFATGSFVSLVSGVISYKVAEKINNIYASKKLDEIATTIESKLSIKKH